METTLLFGVWLAFNVVVAYLTYRIVVQYTEPTAPADEASPAPSDASTVSPTNLTNADGREQTPAQQEVGEEQIRCWNCGQIQEAEFTFCELCISPLHRAR